MRKDLVDMNDDEKRAELAFQRDHFRHLVSSLPIRDPIPKTSFGRWWREWGEVVTTTVKIVVYTSILCGAIAGGMWVMITLLTAL